MVCPKHGADCPEGRIVICVPRSRHPKTGRWIYPKKGGRLVFCVPARPGRGCPSEEIA